MWIDVEFDELARSFVAITEHGERWLLNSRSYQSAVVEAEMKVSDREDLMDEY